MSVDIEKARFKLRRYEDLIIKSVTDGFTNAEHDECVELRKWIMKAVGILP